MLKISPTEIKLIRFGGVMSDEKRTVHQQEPAPIGTWVLLMLVALAMTAGWLFLYFGVFLPRGTIS